MHCIYTIYTIYHTNPLLYTTIYRVKTSKDHFLFVSPYLQLSIGEEKWRHGLIWVYVCIMMLMGGETRGMLLESKYIGCVYGVCMGVYGYMGYIVCMCVLLGLKYIYIYIYNALSNHTQYTNLTPSLPFPLSLYV